MKMTRSQRKNLEFRIVWMAGYEKGVTEGVGFFRCMVSALYNIMVDKRLVGRIEKAVGDLMKQSNKRVEEIDAEIALAVGRTGKPNTPSPDPITRFCQCNQEFYGYTVFTIDGVRFVTEKDALHVIEKERADGYKVYRKTAIERDAARKR